MHFMTTVKDIHRHEANDDHDKSLGVLFNPQSVAIIGASDDTSRIGGRPVLYLKNYGFLGSIYPVNLNRAHIQGLQAYSSVELIPGEVSLAIVALPANAVLEAVRACARKGVKVVIIFSAGFAESHEDGAAEQAELVEVARAAGMRLLGPNCLGAFNLHTGFIGTFSQAFLTRSFVPGPVAIASQSGACGAHLAYLFGQKGVGVGYWATTGNESDIDVTECMLWMAQRADVQVIVVYVEAVRNGTRFVQALELARSNRKAVIALKVGRSAAGARAAASHTGALAGEAAVYDAVLSQHGAYRADSMEEVVDIAYACVQGRYLVSRKIGVVTLSGGVGVQIADAADAHGLELPAMPDEAQRRIKEMIPFAGTGNPIDVTGQNSNDRSLLGRCVQITMTEGNYASVIVFVTSGPAADDYADRLMGVAEAARAARPDCLLVLSFLAPQKTIQRFQEAGFVVFEDVNRAVRAIAALAQFSEHFARGVVLRETQVLAEETPLKADQISDLDELGAKKLLASVGVPMLTEHFAADDAEVARAAQRVNGPTVLKILSPDIAHKTEVGGVVVGLTSPEAAAQAARAMLARVRERLPNAKVRGFLVAPQLRGGIEAVCGVFRDPVFGPVVMFGLGGVYVEVLRDVVFRLAPFSEDEAFSMVRELRAVALFDGVRGARAADVGALAQILSRLSHFAWAQRDTIHEIDINPLMVMPQGEGVFALDALIVASRDTQP